ncbi:MULTISPECIES: AAA family ATPase [Lactobacillus]|uniref:DNA repair protein n=1 Tax=Lactobacillus xujianguonis TaxID=2495899 RepID=A0A437SUK6_9LACO|nr:MULTISPECIES: AAA family ATPase [Lactobacillus]RVU70584.1 DNA repair protein [Lactobacillus xujianguonis]
MRLKKIKFINFGQLSNLTFNLPSPELNVFFGENEAGKSTTVAFIKQVMFGFYLRSNSSPFFEDYKPLAHVSPMGGSLFFEDEHGSEFELERLWAKGDKTKRGILTVKKDGQVVPESLFYDQLQKIDGNFYADSFIFNQEMLGQVASLSQADLLERIYYLGAADSGKLLALRDDFAKEAGQLFKKTGKKPQVNQLLKKVSAKREAVAEAEDEYQDYESLEAELTAKQTSLKQVQEQLAAEQKEQSQLANLQKSFQSYHKLQELEAEVKPLKFTSSNYQEAQSLQAQGKNLQANLANLEKQAASLASAEDLTAEKQLLQKRPELLQWQSEYQADLQKEKQLKNEEQQLLTLNPDLAAGLKLSQADLQTLASDYRALPEKAGVTAPTKSNNNLFLLIGAVIAVVGLILLFTSGITGLILLIAGVAVAGYGFYQNKNQAQVVQEAQKAQKQVEQQYQSFQKKYGLDPASLSVDNLINQVSQYRMKQQALEANNEQLTQIETKCGQLAAKLEEALNEPLKADFNSLLAAMTELDDRISRSQQVAERKASLAFNLKQGQQELKELGLKLKAVLAKDQVKDMTEYDQRYQGSLAQAKLQAQVASLQYNLHDDLAQLKQVDPASLKEKLAQVASKIATEQEKVNQLQQEAAQVQVKLTNLADSSNVFAAKQDLANTQTRLMQASQEYLANLLASKWIGRALDLASNERFPKMLKAAKEYLQLLTGGRYVDLELDKKLTVTRFDGKKREVKYLSRGTAEQLYFALKLAFVEQIKDQINLPILIDDSFVNFDDQRVGYIKQLLQKISANNQVLIFTAQRNLVDEIGIEPMFFEKGTPNA